MKLLLKTIAVISLSLIVLFATTGFYIFEHHCTRSGNMQTALSLDGIDCDHHKKGSKDEVCKSNKCCILLTKFFKLNSPFERTKELNNIEIKKITSDVFCISDRLFTKTDIDQRLYINLKAPPLIRKEQLFLTQQLKLAPPVC